MSTRTAGKRYDNGSYIVFTQAAPARASDHIWIIRKYPEPGALLKPDLDTFERLEEPGVLLSALEPTMTLDYEVLDVLSLALGETLPPSAASERHLTDAIEVRDRLLKLVEEGKA